MFQETVEVLSKNTKKNFVTETLMGDEEVTRRTDLSHLSFVQDRFERKLYTDRYVKFELLSFHISVQVTINPWSIR